MRRIKVVPLLEALAVSVLAGLVVTIVALALPTLHPPPGSPSFASGNLPQAVPPTPIPSPSVVGLPALSPLAAESKDVKVLALAGDLALPVDLASPIRRSHRGGSEFKVRPFLGDHAYGVQASFRF